MSWYFEKWIKNQALSGEKLKEGMLVTELQCRFDRTHRFRDILLMTYQKAEKPQIIVFVWIVQIQK